MEGLGISAVLTKVDLMGLWTPGKRKKMEVGEIVRKGGAT